jgi:flagellar hook-basal body complex protein FliE
MQIGANSLLQEMQSLKGEIKPSFGAAPNIMQQVNNTSGADFGQLLSQAVGGRWPVAELPRLR